MAANDLAYQMNGADIVKNAREGCTDDYMDSLHFKISQNLKL
jgi:hypothetical protein